MSKRFDRKTVLVTGAAAGIGAAAAERFASEGARVACVDLRLPTEAVDRIKAAGGTALACGADVSNREQVIAAFRKAEEALGPVDVLVNNAGIGFPDPILGVTEENWDQVMAVNVKGAFLFSQEAIRSMQGRGGAIVNVSSIAGRRLSVTNGAHYTSSKYALIGLTRHLANEVASLGIRVNAVCPGPTQTPALQRNATPVQQVEIAGRIPLGRVGSPDDIAGVILFVAGDEARYMTGAILDVNGGLY